MALAPVSDLRRAYDLHLSSDAVVEFLGGTPYEVPQRYSEASALDLPIAVPQVIIHGKHYHEETRATTLRGWLRPATMRQQFILTEILQPPLALREPGP